MLVLRPITAGQSRYYLDAPAPGRWVGTGSEDLALRGPVDDRSLPAVLAGHRPGGELLLARVSARRRSGFDLIFAAPKSVSLLAALGDDQHQARFHRAHDEAVKAALGYLEREAVWTRRAGNRTATAGLVAAAFAHSKSGAGDPHLHTHVVVANVVRGDDGRWSCLDSRALYRHAGAAGAVFQSALRHHLSQQGLRFEWTVNRHGLGDIVGVSRAAIEAASLRHREVRAEIAAGMAGRVGRATAAGRSRGATERSPTSESPHETPTRGPSPAPASSRSTAPAGDAAGGNGPWRERVAATGLDDAAAARLLTVAAMRPTVSLDARPMTPDPGSLARLLSEQHSQFRRPDVVRAAATLSVGGAPAAALESAADDFLKTAIPAAGDAWTTLGLRRLEERIVADAAPPNSALVRRAGVGLVASGTPPPEGVSPGVGHAVDRLTRGGAPVDLLGGDLMSQAAVLDSARQAWEASGHRVAIASPTERGLARWRSLAALERPHPAPGHATVLMVDNAERWSTTDLHRVITDATARHAKVVLLDGGTAPRRQRAESPAFETLRASLRAIDPGPSHQRSGTVEVSSRHAVVEGGREGTVIVAESGRAAMDHLVGEWHRRRVAGERPRMVALGPEEAEHLNALARARRVNAGELAGPSVEMGGRTFQAGDEVAALRRDARLGSVPGGTVGRVAAVDPERGAATIAWQGRPETVTITVPESAPPGAQAQGRRPAPLAHAYATTPPFLRRGHDGPILGLGDVESVAPRLHPDRVYDVAPTPPADLIRDQMNPLAALLAGLPSQPETRPAVAADIGRPLAELVGERDRLAEYLRTTIPPDTGPELRRLAEERDSLLSIPDRLRRPDQTSRITALEERRATLAAAAGRRTEWLQGNRGHIGQWAVLTRAVAMREAALGRGAEVRPPVAVLAALGPPPEEAADRAVWRRAAVAIEAHRDRWGLPDRPLELAHQSPPGPDFSRRADELRVIAASQELQRTRGRGRGRSLAPSGP